MNVEHANKYCKCESANSVAGKFECDLAVRKKDKRSRLVDGAQRGYLTICMFKATWIGGGGEQDYNHYRYQCRSLSAPLGFVRDTPSVYYEPASTSDWLFIFNLSFMFVESCLYFACVFRSDFTRHLYVNWINFFRKLLFSFISPVAHRLVSTVDASYFESNISENYECTCAAAIQ